MNLSELINEILSEWAYRVNDGMPDPKNPTHIKELGIVLSEMGLSHIKKELVENLLMEKGKTPEPVKEDDKAFTNPILNKKVSYKNDKGEDKEGIVGNLLRQPEGSPARTAAERMLPPEGSPERDELNKELGGEGQANKPEDGKGKDGGEDAAAKEKEKQQQAQAMFDPKVDPAMAQRLDKEKEIQSQLAKDAEEADKEADKEVEAEKENEFQPIEAKDVQAEIPQADPDTFGGGSDIPDGVPAADLEQFNTDINKVAKQVADAKAKGEKAPNINLCDVTIPGTNLYCDDNLGIPRDEMPQFKGKATPGSRAASMDADASGEVDTEPVFKEMLKEKGIKTLQTQVPADKLKATQKDLVGAKVVGMMGALEEDPNHEKITAPIYVSRDGYVIDGHHRWAAIVAYNAQHPDSQIQMKTTVLDMDIKDAIPMANKFAEDMGIAAKKADANKETPTQVTSAPDGKVNAIAKKAIDKIKDGVKNWSVEEKEFFNKKVHKGNSPQRRSFGEAFKHKMKGAWEAIKHGAEHEVHTFKEAGSGVKAWFAGEDVSESQKKALVSVAKKVAIAAAMGVAGGGLAHGALAFTKHLMVEFVPHVVAETVLMGAGKAALFAGAEDEDADMMKFMEIIANKLESQDIPEEVMADAVESYNQKKQQPEMKKENLELADELMLEMIYGFIEEAKTASGKYAARSKESGKLVYFDTPEAQKDAVKAGTHEEPDTKQKTNEPVAGADLFKDKESQKRLGKEKDVIGKKEEPKKEQPKKSRVVDSFDAEQIKEIESQYVTIRQAASDEMKEYSKDEYSAKEMPAGYTDDEYYSPKRKTSTAVRKQPYKFDNNTRAQLKASGFPTKYAQFIERCINTKVKGKKPPVTELIDQGGAGQIQSQFGEVMAMALMSVRDPQQRAQLAQILKSEIEKSNKEFGGSAIATTEWIDASLSHAESFDSSMDEKYGKGMWKFDGAAWDIKNDIEGLGLDYKNKGFSTDVMLRVQPLDKKGNPNGPARAQRCSLKKDENIMFFNGSIGEVENFILNYTSEDSRKKIRMYEGLLSKSNSKNPEEKAKAIEAIKRLTGQASVKAAADTLKAGIKELRDEAYNAAPKEVQDVVNRTRNFMNDQLKSAVNLAQYASVPMKPKELQDAVNSEFKDSGDREYAVMAYKFAQSCAKQNGEVTSDCLRNKLKEAGEEAGTDRVSKLCVFLARTAKAAGYDVEDQLKAHYNIGKKLGSDLMKVIPKSKEMLGGVMQKLAEAFPMKVCMDGEEFMLIDGIKVTNKTLNTVFGVGSYDDLQKGMDVVELPNGDTVLVYKAGGGGKQIPIGFVRGRQKGLGYESSVGFEIQCSDDFAYACSVANKDNGDESNGNAEAIKRIGGRIEKRNKKKK